MRVLLVTMCYPPDIGGGQKYSGDLARYLSRKGHRVTVVTQRSSKQRKEEILESTRVIRMEFPPLYVYAKNLFQSLVGIAASSFKISKIIRKHKIDIVQCNFVYPSGLCGILAARLCSRRAAVTPLGVDVLKNAEIGYGVRRNVLGEIFVRLSIKLADRVITPTKAIHEAVAGETKSESRIRRIPVGVDANVFKPCDEPKRKEAKTNIGIEDGPMILTVARLEKVKGIDTLIRAAPGILHHYPNSHFVICGDGSERKSLKDLVETLGIGKSVIFTGFITESMPMFYIAADIFVLPSIMEGGSLSILEAFSSGKPVIGSRVGGIPSLIQDGVNGFLVRPKDPEDLAKSVIRLLRSQHVAESMGKMGRMMIETIHAWDIVVDRMIELYNELLEE